MFDAKAYRDTVLKPLQGNQAQQAAIAEALRGLNHSRGADDALATVAQVDLVALFGVPAGASDAELAQHFKSLEMFLNKGMPPVARTLGTLLKGVQAKLPDYKQPEFWKEMASAASSAAAAKLDSLGEAVQLQETLRIISAERLRKLASAHGISASVGDRDLAALVAKHGVQVMRDFEAPSVPVDAPPMRKELHPEFRSILDAVLLHDRQGPVSEITVIDGLSYQASTGRLQIGVGDIARSKVAADRAASDANESAKKTLNAIALQCESDDDLAKLALAWFLAKADELIRKQGLMLTPAVQALVRAGLADLDARRILGKVTEASTGPSIDQVTQLVADGSLTSAARLLHSLTDGQPADSVPPAVKAAETAVSEALARKQKAVDDYQAAVQEQNFEVARRALTAARAADKEDPDLIRWHTQLPPDPPAGLQIAVAVTGEVALSWRGAQGDEIRYAVVRSETGVPVNPKDGHQLTSATRNIRLVDPAPVVARSVTYAVFAFRLGSDVSAPATVQTTLLPPPCKMEVSATANDATLFWRTPAEASGVSVELIAPDGRRTPFPVSGTPQVHIPGLTLGERYRVLLTAHYILPNGQSATSKPASIDVIPRGVLEAVTDLRVVGCSMPDGRPGLRCRWTEVSGYLVELWSLPLDSGPPVGGRVTEDGLLNLTGSRITGSVRSEGTSRILDLHAFPDVRLVVPVAWDDHEGLCGVPQVAGSAPPPRNIEVVRLGTELQVSWHWPHGDYLAQVAWVGRDDSRGSIQVERESYKRNGGVRIPDASAVNEVTVSTVARGAGQQYVGAPVSVQVAAMRPTLSYTVDLPRGLFGGRQVRVEVASAEHRGPVELIAVAAPGAFMPTRAADGDEVARLVLDLSGGMPQQATFTIQKYRSPYWVRLFPVRGHEYALSDPPTATMKG